jgi:uncharacterized protein (TIGR00661 family)
MNSKKRILVAPLNWGLGHATRCIPIVKALLEHNFEPIIASDGEALKLLEKEFPHLQTIQLPSYNITYSKKAKNFKYKLLKDAPKTLKAIRAERKLVTKLVNRKEIDGIISDNRLGVRSKQVPSVFITHQLNVLSGYTTWISSIIQQGIIKKFDACWVPDVKGEPNLCGELGHLKNSDLNIEYLGTVSRLEKRDVKTKYDLLVLLSGPEPQRTLLEDLLKEEITAFTGRVLMVRGCIEHDQKKETKDHFTSINFLTSEELEIAINQSEIILSRSGYTTILDLAKLEKKAFFIPTPGQYEQEYLAKRLNKLGVAPFSAQEDFRLNDLERISDYSGFTSLGETVNYKRLFRLFQSE